MSKYSSIQAEQIRKIATYLKEQRVKQGFSIEQIASMTFIRLPMLKALESANIEQLPELIYVQGFIRRYGEALGIDGHSLSHQINASQVEKPTISPNLVSAPTQESSVGQEVPATLVNEDNKKSVAVKSKPRTLVHPSEETAEPSEVSWLRQLKLYWIYLLVLGGAIAGLFYLFSRPPATEQTAQTQDTETVTRSTKPETTVPLTQPSSPITKPEVTSQQTQTEETAQTTENANTLTQPETIISSEEPSPILESPQATLEATTSNTSEATGNSTISPETANNTISETATEKAITAALQLEGDSWLQVRVDGEVEYEGILKEGEQQNWDAQETLTIRAGNAGAVKLSVNNKPAEVIGELGEVKTVEVTPDS
ncbi:unknown [Crocosphaera subtropica ATCC 51142]|uniref:Cytoskeleton protein RodZ-like C-terminal domain-containing protein n=1 Tax=Crocosphaera subtropica (strain ATCC 51142 / BH68) TaxID=43989 RepID=B1WY62_CROS5|nr:helix-turn-helix domain-containing protein [Crocosphaera subtropica]ACB52646.1 unknown [Crocosphaera subtropica ATCC 51142]